jgi:hypothetical protein
LQDAVCGGSARHGSRISWMTQLASRCHGGRWNKKSPADTGDS